ncbi:MAG TPA: hypothetical protein VH764_09695 [Gemmatimonadales bacterium]|jgi:hypothetical protein
MKSLPSFCALALIGLAGCADAGNAERSDSQGGAAADESGLPDSAGVTLESKLPASFGQISNVVELDRDRVAFADTREKLFLAGTFGSGKVDTLGQRVEVIGKDTGPGQYKFPGWVARLAGDTVALVDFAAIRTTLWSREGKPLRVLPLKAAAGSAPVLVYDTVGHGYRIDYQTMLGGEPGMVQRPDSVPVLRMHLGSSKVDTVAHLAAPQFGKARFGEQVQDAAMVFAPNDFFGVLPDGSAWVARGKENRVDWRSTDGTWSRGPSRQYQAQPVTQADRDRVLAQVREQGKQYGMPQELSIEYPFAEKKPPFDFALGRPNAEVWLQRPRAAEAAPLVYDVYDGKGVWRRQVTLPAGVSLAGFGPGGAIYGSVKNDDGTKSVGRYRLSGNR